MQDFSTPTAAILSLEAAYRTADIEAAVACRNFPAEAWLMLTATNPQAAQDPEIRRQTAEVLELAYRKGLSEGGFPDMRNTRSEFPHQELIGQDLMQVTEVFYRPGVQPLTHLIHVVRSSEGWHVVTLPPSKPQTPPQGCAQTPPQGYGQVLPQIPSIQSIVGLVLCAKPRVTGIIFFLCGIACLLGLIDAHRTSGTFFLHDLTLTPMLLLWGLGVVIEPRILTSLFATEARPVPLRYKALSIGIMIIAGVAGLIAEHTLFRDWHTARP